MYIYKRTNTVNGKVYIGQSVRDEEEDPRWSECISEAKAGRGFRLGAAIRKYGDVAFRKEVLYRAKSQYELDRMETFFIILHQSHVDGYNVNLGGRGNTGPCTPERRENVRKGILALPDSIRRKSKPPRTREHNLKIGLKSSERRHTSRTKEINRVRSLQNWQDEKYRKVVLFARLLVMKRTSLRICYGCFKPFRCSNGYNEQVFCSNSCSSRDHKFSKSCQTS